MNDLSTARHPIVQEFFTAREMAEIALRRGITSFPATEFRAREYAKRLGWNELGRNLCRPRKGKGGGLEYHLTLMPQVLRDALSGWDDMAMMSGALRAVQNADERKLSALRLSAIAPRARSVVQARAEILHAIEGYAISQGEKRSWGISRFIEAQDEFHIRQRIEARRDAGITLSQPEIKSLGVALLLTASDGFQIDSDKLVIANDRREKMLISRSTLYRWFKGHDVRGILALAPIPPKQSQPIPQAFYDFLKFYSIGSKPSVTEAYKDYVAAAEQRDGAQPMTLTLDQVQYVLRNRLNNIEKNVGREGLLTLRSRMAYITRTTDDMWPTTVYTADGKTFDAEVADPVSRRPMRPEITSVLDVATRKCVGYAVSRKENVIAVTEALRRSCSANGVCAIFYTDRGAGYKNKTFDADAGGLMARLGITKMHALPYNSQAKGIIERFNHTWNDLARRMPTYMGRDMDKEAGKAIHKETRSEIKEFGTARRLPSWEEFIASVEKTIVGYNDEPHEGLPRFEDPQTGRLRHMTPNEAWAAHVANGFEPIMIDQADEDDLFRPYTTCVASRCQVKWNTNHYFHENLEGYHSEKVMVGYDLNQADKVWVREFDPRSGNPGKLICVAVFHGNAQRYIPLTAEQKALEDRNKSALKRLDRKRDDKLAELNAPFMLDHAPQFQPTDFIDLAPVARPEPANNALPTPVKNATPAQRKGYLNPDAELAMQVIADPSQLTPGRARLLRDLMSHRSGQELLRISGVDLTTLDDLLRSAA